MLHSSLQTPLNADFSAFCPVEGFHQLLAIGTYQLDESSQQRLGGLHLYDTSSTNAAGLHDMHELQSVQQPGIFGMEWVSQAYCDKRPGIALALANGCLQFMRLDQDISLQACGSVQIDAESLVLSVDSQRQGAAGSLVAATTANCQAATVQVHAYHAELQPALLHLALSSQCLRRSEGGRPMSELSMSGQGVKVGSEGYLDCP